jgi:hypothetical protein
VRVAQTDDRTCSVSADVRLALCAISTTVVRRIDYDGRDRGRAYARIRSISIVRERPSIVRDPRTLELLEVLARRSEREVVCGPTGLGKYVVCCVWDESSEILVGDITGAAIFRRPLRNPGI